MSEVKKMKPSPSDHCDTCGKAIYGWCMSHYNIRQTGAVICAECGGDEPVKPLPPKPEPEAL